MSSSLLSQSSNIYLLILFKLNVLLKIQYRDGVNNALDIEQGRCNLWENTQNWTKNIQK